MERLVLVDSYGLGGEVPWKLLTWLQVRLPGQGFPWAVARTHRGAKWGLKLQMRDWLVTAALVDEVRREARRPRAGLVTNYAGRLGRIRCPILILHGREDRLIPVDQARRAHGLIAGSKLAVFEGCGHWLPGEEPEQFARAVLGFLPARWNVPSPALP